MNFTNDNPCNYHYVKVENDFVFDIDPWSQKVLPSRNQNIKTLYELQNNPNHKMYNIPIKMTLEEYERERSTYEWYTTSEWNEDGSPIEITIPDLEQRVKENSGLSCPTAFREIQKVHTSGIDRLGISHIGKLTNYHLHHHFHPPIKNKDGTYNRDCHSVVVIIPMTHNDPVTETVFLNHQEFVSMEEEHIISLCRETASPYTTLRGNVTSVLMPSPGEYLVLEFNGSRCLHWLENYGTKNEYLCLLAEN